MNVHVDVSGLVLDARPIVAAAAALYLRYTEPWFVGLLAHGSAVKGGFIPGCSDIDLQLYLDDAAFSEDGQLPFELLLALHADLARIDPAPFQYIQCYPFGSRLRDGWVGPIPGAYRLLAGRLPFPEATADQLRASAQQALAGLRPLQEHLTGALIEHSVGGVALARHLRLLCTEVWPTLYHVLSLRERDPLRVWGLPKPAAMGLLPPSEPLGPAIRAFHDALWVHYAGVETTQGALDCIAKGVAFLRAAKVWFAESAGRVSGG